MTDSSLRGEAIAFLPGSQSGASEQLAGDLRVAVIVVNYKAAELTIDCLHSMVDEVKEIASCRVIVVDNASGDGSAERLQDAIDAHGWSEWASLLPSDRNGGFASGCNLALRAIHDNKVTADYILLLNPDTVIRPGAFRILMEFLDEHPDVGIAGGRSEDPDTTPQLCCFRFPNLTAEFAGALSLGVFDRMVSGSLTRLGIPEEPAQVDWLSGALMMIRSSVIDQIGLLDESYFLYFEETDFILRARRAGWTCWHVPASRAVHFVGQTTGVTRREGPKARLPGYWFESRRRYFVLNHGRLYAVAVDLAVIIGHCLRRLRYAVQRRRDDAPPRFLRDLIAHSALWRGRSGLRERSTSL